jgi:Family of unknown function (DUF5906)
MVFGSDAKPTAAGGYRVTSRALERQLQEDLSFHPDGVMDWGLERGLTPIDVVIQHGSAPDAPTAALWLCERMGKDPASLGWRGGSKRGGPGEAGQEEKDAALDYMNKKYAVVQIGGKMRIAYFEPSPVSKGVDTIVYSDKTNFIALRERERVQVIAQNGITKSVGIGRWWLAHERRRQYERVAFDPGCTDRETFNLWQGFSCEPVKGDCGLYLDHLSQNVCNGDQEHFTYLLNWMARAVQDPGTQGEVAVVLRGKEGTGKGIAIGQFGKLFGAHFLQVSQPRHLVGNFNGPLQSVSVLFADEAFFAGDRSHEGVLKALVTEPTLQIEIKGVEPVTARNALHIMMSSNSAWVVPAGADARRFFCLDVSDRRKQDTTYTKPQIE